MTNAVEASSLASITSIAANPPLHIQDAESQALQQLTLYITRVPGSRDVILTPLKPRDRIVSAEDIQSALYYIHFNTIDDVEIISRASYDDESRNQHSQQHTDEDPEVQPPLPPRKPMLGQTTPPFDALPPQLPPRHLQIRRKPVVSDIVSMQTSGQPILPRRPLPPLPPEDDMRQMSNLYQLTPTPLSPSEAADFEQASGSLTLIRREPVTAEQWNVATIRDGTGMITRGSNGLTAAQKVKKGGAPLDIEISNPAYFVFDATSSPANEELSRSSRQCSASEQAFHRRLYLSRALSDDASGYSDAFPDMRKRGYCFKSPWDGLCEFTTTSAGRALICRHAQSHGHSLDVSELRFNLPSGSSDLAAKAQKRQSYIPADKRRSRMDALRGLSRSEDVDFDLDLALGQEMAGGGFGGRQPKLGKLIIHSPGLAMLDLLVAANIGLWWRAWEKVS